MNKYAEIFENKGIATIFAENFANDYADFFGENTAAAVDRYVMHKHSAKYVCNDIENQTTAAAVVCATIQINLQTWQKIHATLNLQYNAAQSGNETITKTGSVTHENTNSQTQTDSEKAFNDNDFVADSQNAVSFSGLVTDRYNLTDTKTAVNGDVSERVEKEINLRKRNNLQTQIIETIINEICLTIYE